ncbi:MAG: hypothetical protein ACKOAH_04705, partial [Pirellula sp.]
ASSMAARADSTQWILPVTSTCVARAMRSETLLFTVSSTDAYSGIDFMRNGTSDWRLDRRLQNPSSDGFAGDCSGNSHTSEHSEQIIAKRTLGVRGFRALFASSLRFQSMLV